ncbi:Tim17/Tim22/Tim23/Pmp24 family protein [Sesbania bispinosa]|nr:Tim17/Tim22/Tim23/Pmp24 family protein [Sesbania bispinosa]
MCVRVAGAGTGLISKHRKSLGLANVCASYAANFAIITGCYCGAREFVTATRKTGPDDLWSSAIAGFGSGALLGRLHASFIVWLRVKFFEITNKDLCVVLITKLLSHEDQSPSPREGGQVGAVRYSLMFAVAGTTADFAILKLKDFLRDHSETIYQDIENSKKNGNWLRLPEWFPIRVLDEEALATKRKQEEQFLAQRARIRSLREEES